MSQLKSRDGCRGRKRGHTPQLESKRSHFAPFRIVAEQFPYEASYNKAREIVAAGKIGPVYSFALDFFNYVVPDSKYHATAWRNKPDYQGG